MLVVGQCVQVDGRTVRIVGRAGTVQRPIIALENVPDRASAEALRGADITVAASELASLSSDEYLVDDLLGLRVSDGEVQVGTVVDVLVLPANEVLEVRRPDGETLLVPMVAAAIRQLDVSDGLVDIDLSFLGEA